MPENGWEGVIEPDNDFCLGPDDVAYNAIIPRYNPSPSLGCCFHALAENFQRRFCPIALPVQCIQFDEVVTEFVCERFRKCGFT